MRQPAPSRAGTQGPEAPTPGQNGRGRNTQDRNGQGRNAQSRQRQTRAVNMLRAKALADSGKLIARTDPDTPGMAQMRHYHEHLRGAENIVQAVALMEQLAYWYRSVLRNARARPAPEKTPERKPPQLTPLSPEATPERGPGGTPPGGAPKEGWKERAVRWARKLGVRGARVVRPQSGTPAETLKEKMKNMGAGGRGWTEYEDAHVYLKKELRTIGGDPVLVLTLGNISRESRKNNVRLNPEAGSTGFMDRFMEELESMCLDGPEGPGADGVLVERVVNEFLPGYLERRGYRVSGQGPPPSYIWLSGGTGATRKFLTEDPRGMAHAGAAGPGRERA